MKKLILAAIAIVAAIGVYLYINKPHRSVQDEEALRISADSLFQAFASNEADANAKYLNKVVLVSGKVTSVETNTDGNTVIVLETGDLMFGVNCTLAEPANPAVGQEIVLRGICTGYLADVIITQAILETP
ncbi:MAG: hypothetical protein JNN04_12355 [Cyclobacteriaceae bacterium]|nr:hypothetical protein [Cyclobacteriaceae bacterium]